MMTMMMKMCSRKMYSVLLLLVIGFIVLNDRMANALPKQEKTERELVQLINKIDNEVSLPLFGGMRIDRSENGRAFGSVKSVESFEQRAERYLQTHTLSFSFPEEEAALENEMDDENTGRSMAEGKWTKITNKSFQDILIQFDKTLDPLPCRISWQENEKDVGSSVTGSETEKGCYP